MSLRGLLVVIVLCAAIASALAVVQVRHEGRQRYVELRGLLAERDELDIEYGRLQLEQATWAEMSRIERVAREELRMVRPDPARITVLRR